MVRLVKVTVLRWNVGGGAHLHMALSISPHFNSHSPGVLHVLQLQLSPPLPSSLAAVKSSHRQTNTQLFTGRMPFLSPNQHCQSTEGETYGHEPVCGNSSVTCNIQPMQRQTFIYFPAYKVLIACAHEGMAKLS